MLSFIPLTLQPGCRSDPWLPRGIFLRYLEHLRWREHPSVFPRIPYLEIVPLSVYLSYMLQTACIWVPNSFLPLVISMRHPSRVNSSNAFHFICINTQPRSLSLLPGLMEDLPTTSYKYNTTSLQIPPNFTLIFLYLVSHTTAKVVCKCKVDHIASFSRIFS